ncbi:MAG: DUF3987 domain-containing protein [Alphaproteobacteria bacterium]|nr:DUF3987 domain-containing protein [Alphaproteobacteria bacterium]
MTLQDVKTQIDNAQEFRPSDSWPDPDLTILVAGRREPPELPLEVFGDFWGGWIAGHAENRSVPADYVAGGLLATSSAMIGNSRWVSPWQGWSEPPVLWIGEVGNPSSGKSPGLDAPLNLLRRIEAEMAEDFPETLRSIAIMGNTERDGQGYSGPVAKRD